MKVTFIGVGEACDHNCDLIVHEAFRCKGETEGHGTVLKCLDMARNIKAKKLALVHITRAERATVKKALAKLQLSIPQVQLFVPEADAQLEI